MTTKSLCLAVALVLGLALVSVFAPVNQVRMAATNALLAIGSCSFILGAAKAIMSVLAGE